MIDTAARPVFDEELNLFRDQVRKFYDKALWPNLERWEADGIIDRDFWRACGDAGLHFERALRVAILEHFDERHEEIVHSLAKLLHVRVLIGGSFVAVDRDALIHDASLEIELLAE